MSRVTRRAVLWASMVVAGLVAGGCDRGPKEAPAPPPGGAGGTPTPKIRVVMIPKKKGVPYFTSCAEGAKQAAEELGVELIYDGPTDGSAEKAAAMIERWTAQGVDVIAVSPNDPNVLAPAMRAARQKGVRVITWDADGEADAREFMVNQATSREIGFALVDTMVQDLGGKEQAKGDVAIVTATLTAANQNEWIAFMKERLGEYPGLRLVEIKPSNEDQRLAFQVTKDLIAAYPDLRGIWGISSVSFPAAAEAVKQAGKSGKVLVTGLSTPNDMKAAVKDGTVKSVVLWNTKDLGYLTVQAAKALIDGRLKPGNATLEAGRLGPKVIEGDRILLGDILVFTKDNIDQFDF